MESLPDIVKPIYDMARANIKTYPCHSNRASMLGSDCERELTYWRTQWDQALLHDVERELIFREGRTQEQAVLRALSEAGIDVIEQQQMLNMKEYNITGHVDGVIVVDGKAIPLEIKSMSDFIWKYITRGSNARVRQWSEVHKAFTRRPWLRRYSAQLQIYMLAKNAERSIMLCKNKVTGAIVQINLGIDWEYAESLLKRAERINHHVSHNTLPDRIEWSPQVCGDCPFLHLCMPDRVMRDPMMFATDDEAIEKLQEREETRDAREAYNRANRWIKEWAWKRHEKIFLIAVGDWVIQKKISAGGKQLTKISYTK